MDSCAALPPIVLKTSACVGVWSGREQTWTYCGAGYPGGLLSTDGQIRHLPPTRPLLGVMADAHWSSHKLSLHQGDRLFLYTDGIIEAGAPDDTLTQHGLEQIVRQSPQTSLEEQLALIMAEVSARSSGHPQDDATLLAVEFPSDKQRGC